jgi:hypothetical protein
MIGEVRSERRVLDAGAISTSRWKTTLKPASAMTIGTLDLVAQRHCLAAASLASFRHQHVGPGRVG